MSDASRQMEAAGGVDRRDLPRRAGTPTAPVAGGSRPVDFPDFTRGRWKTRPQLGIVW